MRLSSYRNVTFLATLMIFGVVALLLRAHPAPAAKRKTVVLELFTSEGCSSCPPADALLSRLAQGRSTNGAEIIPLGFHVDYWDHLGWRDRFSSHDYTARQEEYATRFREEPYTPQLVIDGEAQLVGSDSNEAESAIQLAAGEPPQADVQLALQAPNELSVTVSAANPGSTAEVLLAITEDNLATNVAGGENGGHVLHHSAVVRGLQVLGRVSHGHFEAQVPIKPAADWKLKDLRLVTFVQSAPVGPIEAAATIPLVAAH